MVSSLLTFQQITTTLQKAKEAKKLADRVITLGKKDSLHARRQVFSFLQNNELTSKLFKEVAPRFKDRKGGYTRILQLDRRKGDGAQLALLELTEKAIKIKETDWIVLTNASPLKVDHFSDIPIKRDGNAFIYLRDVATVRLMGRVQQNAVLVKGKQTVILVAMKSTDASTLDVVNGIKKMIPRAEQISPPLRFL